jgi:3-phenylpropionate/trans-cinnamate dioxygenase ferredoxin subunit
MSDLVEVGKIDELVNGTMKAVAVKGHEILLARVGEKYYAADNRCPHMGGKLSQGKLEGNIVTCPRHGSRFDLSDGQVVSWLKSSGLISKLSRALKPPRSLVIYDVKVEDNRILIEI